MAEIVAHFTNGNVPLTSPGTVPTVRIRRIDTGALVVTDSDMTELGDGSYQFTFAPVATLEYSIRADGDPAAAGQVTPGERYKFGDLSGITENTLDKLGAALIIGPFTVSSASAVILFTDATEATGAFAGGVLVAITATGASSKRIFSYLSPGVFTLEPPGLSLVPAIGDKVYVINVDVMSSFEILSDITPFAGATIELLDDHARGTIRINRTTDPWREEHLDVEDGTTVRDSFDMFDGDGNAINDANPLTNFIKERRRV